MRCVGVCFMIQVEGNGAGPGTGQGAVSVTETGHNSAFSSHLVSIAGQDRYRYRLPYQVAYPFGDPAQELDRYRASVGGDERKPHSSTGTGESSWTPLDLPYMDRR